MEQLKELFDKGHGNPAALTAEDKKYIRAKAAEHGVTIGNTRCKSCWTDAIVQIITAIKRADGVPVPEEYQLREPYATQGLNWNGRFISQAIMTKELHDEMRAAGLCKFFVK